MKRFFTLILLILLALAALLYIFRLQAGNFLLPGLLARAGAKDIQLELSDLNSTTIVFSRADWTINGYRFSLRGGSFGWNRAALAGKRLDTIALDRLTVELPKEEQGPARKNITVEQVDRGLEQIGKRLPFRTLIIKHLTLTGPAAGALAGRELRLKLEKNKQKITGELAFVDQSLALTLNSVNPAQWNLILQEPGQTEPVFSARLNLEDEPIRVQIETDLARLEPINTLFNKPLPKMEGKLGGTLTLSLKKERKASLVLHLQKAGFAGTTAASVKLALHGRLDTSGKLHMEDHSILEFSGLEHNNKKISIAKLTVGLDGILEQTEKDRQFSFAPEATLFASGLKGPGLTIQSARIFPAMMAILSREKITLNLKPEWSAQVTGFRSDSLYMAETTVQPEKNVRIAVALNDGLDWSIARSRWRWTIKNLRHHDLSLDPDPITINIEQPAGTAENLQIKAELTSQRVELRNTKNGLSLQEIKAEFTVDAEHITGTASFAPETVPGTLALRFSHDLKNGIGQASFTSDHPFSFSEITPLSSILNQWPFAFDLTGGQLRLNGPIHWQREQPVQASLQVELLKGKGNYKETLFSGLAIRQDLQLLPTIQSRRHGSVAIDTLETGITVKNIAMETDFAPSPHGPLPKITIRNLSASLFGGTVSDDFLVYDPQQPEVKSTIRLNNIDLARLVTSQQVKGLEVTGRIEGSLPIILDKTGLRMDEGKLKNTGNGGLIKYTLAGHTGLKKSPLTGLALKALEDFHYNLLSATAKYNPDGELQVSLHLEGKSPGLDTSRPVHLNINTEQNLLSLLKSLRYSRSLTGEIDKEVRQHYQE